jgi:hypothetical protein
MGNQWEEHKKQTRIVEAVTWHLKYNFYPPMGQQTINMVVEAVLHPEVDTIDIPFFGGKVTRKALLEEFRLDEYL